MRGVWCRKVVFVISLVGIVALVVHLDAAAVYAELYSPCVVGGLALETVLTGQALAGGEELERGVGLENQELLWQLLRTTTL